MKKENDEMFIITQELEVIIPPNDVLTEQMDSIVGGGAPGLCICNKRYDGCILIGCNYKDCQYSTPPGPPGAQ